MKAQSPRTKEYNIRIGGRVKFFRELRGMSQLELAAAIGYKSSGAISLIERGERGMNKTNIKKAARTLAVHPYVLTAEETLTGDQLILLNQFMRILKDPNQAPHFKDIKRHIEKDSESFK